NKHEYERSADVKDELIYIPKIEYTDIVINMSCINAIIADNPNLNSNLNVIYASIATVATIIDNNAFCFISFPIVAPIFSDNTDSFFTSCFSLNPSVILVTSSFDKSKVLLMINSS